MRVSSALVAFCLVTLAAARAAACSCVEVGLEESIASAPVIFEGVVDSVEIDEAADARVVRFAVTQAWRGVSSERVEVRTHARESACGYPFEIGRAYLVYASRVGGEPIQVSLCSRTRLMDDAGEDRLALGSGVVPVDVVDEEVEPVRPARTAPSRAGCASCVVGASARDAAMAPVLGLLVLGVLAARVARRSRA